jgi:putative transcriptional regulator
MDKNWKELLFQSVKEHNEIAEGKRKPSRVFKASDVSAIRAATGLSQERFARLIDVKIGTLRNWEQGRREPTGPAKALFKALKAKPVEVLEALSAG